MSFIDLHLDRHYDSDPENGLLDLYQKIIRESTRYDRLTGFFSSSIYAAVECIQGESWRHPDKRIRVVCSPALSDQDIDAIRTGYSMRDTTQRSVLEDIERLASHSDETSLGLRALSSLVANGQLEIKIATPKSGHGMYHSKIGLCEDSQRNRLYFHGSANESFQGFALNWETLDIKCSWENEVDNLDIDHWQMRFEDAWGNRLERYEVFPFPEVAFEALSRFAVEDMSEVAADLRKYVSSSSKKEHQTKLIPPLMKHQESVIESWRQAGYRGIVDHVTGAGKTILALQIIEEHCSRDHPALILVPREGLQVQWIDEIDKYLGEKVSVLAVGGELGGGSSRWAAELPRFTSPDTSLGGRVVVAVVRSASGEEFAKRIRAGEHLLVIADEVHNLGSRSARRIFDVLSPCKRRLGMSATYERANDPEGTTLIEKYFGAVLSPRFNIRDAIDAGRLVPYNYDFEVCTLTDLEAQEFERVSEQIRKINHNEDDEATSLALTRLLAKRAHIVKSASAKVELAVKVFRDHYTADDRWLVYCDDSKQLEDVYSALTAAGFPAAKYFFAMAGSKTATLDYLAQPGKIVVAIKCLDEGINIPEVDSALILASSTNPREYIQRRGRVLRRSGTKLRATIIDVLVLNQDRQPALNSEVRRMKTFIEDSLNDAPLLKLMAYLSGRPLRDSIEDFEDEGEDQ